jgi:hypothetical protein
MDIFPVEGGVLSVEGRGEQSWFSRSRRGPEEDEGSSRLRLRAIYEGEEEEKLNYGGCTST